MSELSPLSNYLCEAIDSAAANLEPICEQLEDACNLITQTLLNDRKLIVCGNGHSSPIASLLTTCLMHQQEFERPSLPAINISIDSTTISAIAKDGNYHHVYSKQIRAIGHEGDTLVALSIDGNCSNIVQAIQAAHEKEIKVITLVGFEQGKISAIKQSEDIEVQLHSNSVARAMEAQLMAVNALCYQIENQLFGGAF
jgi:phosphoheptose isomerase